MTTAEQEQKATRLFIKQWLKQGDLIALAEAHKISRSGAYKALSGETKNFAFLQACYELAIERKNLFKKLNDELL